MSDTEPAMDVTVYEDLSGGDMDKSFEIGDRVVVIGQPSPLFTGETGTILDVTMRREDNSAYNVYWVAFRQKRIRMIGLYLKPALAQAARQVC